MQEQLQKQMAEMRVEATAGGGMVTVDVNGHKQLLAVKIDPEVVSKDDVEMLQDLIVAAVNDAHRKVDEALASQMQGMMGGLQHARAVLMARSGSAGRARRGAAAPARHRRPQRAAARVPPAQDAARGGRRARAPRCSPSRTASPTARSAATSPTSIPAPTARRPSATAASSASSSSRRTSRRDREDARLPRPLSRADGRDRAAPGHRPGRSQDQGPARARRRRRRRGSHPRDQSDRRRRSDRALPREAAQAARRRASPASPWACPSAATSTTRTSSRCRRRWRGDGRCRSLCCRAVQPCLTMKPCSSRRSDEAGVDLTGRLWRPGGRS